MKEELQKDTEPLLLLKYFSIFRHPVSADELLRFSCMSENYEGLTQYLEELCAAGTIKKTGGYYLLNGDIRDLDKRLQGEVMAGRLMPRAKQVGRFLSFFPFVKFVGISGSLSKGYANEKTDFDFFIVTAHNTLWICRTMLHLLKKLSFLAGRQHWLCMNYFIDEQHLELEEKNLFTQIELSTLIPVYNTVMYRRLLLHNQPNLPNLWRLIDPVPGEQIPRYDSHSNSLWQSLNCWLMKLTDRKWRKKWQKRGYPMEDYGLAFKTTPYISKNHPKNYQKNILNQLQKQQP